MEKEVLETQVNQQEMIDNAEHMMQAGEWLAAKRSLAEANLHPADMLLRTAQLEYRQECAAYLDALSLSCAGASKSSIREKLAGRFDPFVADWVVNEFKGSCLWDQ